MRCSSRASENDRAGGRKVSLRCHASTGLAGLGLGGMGGPGGLGGLGGGDLAAGLQSPEAMNAAMQARGRPLCSKLWPLHGFTKVLPVPKVAAPGCLLLQCDDAAGLLLMTGLCSRTVGSNISKNISRIGPTRLGRSKHLQLIHLPKQSHKKCLLRRRSPTRCTRR